MTQEEFKAFCSKKHMISSIIFLKWNKQLTLWDMLATLPESVFAQGVQHDQLPFLENCPVTGLACSENLYIYAASGTAWSIMAIVSTELAWDVIQFVIGPESSDKNQPVDVEVRNGMPIRPCRVV